MIDLDTGQPITPEDAQFLLNDATLDAHRVRIPAQVVRLLIEKHLLESHGLDLFDQTNIWIWNPDGANGLELVVVRMPSGGH